MKIITNEVQHLHSKWEPNHNDNYIQFYQMGSQNNFNIQMANQRQSIHLVLTDLM